MTWKLIARQGTLLAIVQVANSGFIWGQQAQTVAPVIDLKVARLNRVNFRDEFVDRVLKEATDLLRKAGCGGKGCNVEVKKGEPVLDFSFASGEIDSQSLAHFHTFPVNALIASKVRGCGQRIGPGILAGCADTDSYQFAIDRSYATEPLYWVHELGHSLGLRHRNYDKNLRECKVRDICAIMNCEPRGGDDKELGMGLKRSGTASVPADECAEFIRAAIAAQHAKQVAENKKKLLVIDPGGAPLAGPVAALGKMSGLWTTDVATSLQEFAQPGALEKLLRYQALVFVSEAGMASLTPSEKKLTMEFVGDGKSVILIGAALKSPNANALSGATGIRYKRSARSDKAHSPKLVTTDADPPNWITLSENARFEGLIPEIRELSDERHRLMRVNTGIPVETTDIAWTRTEGQGHGRVVCLLFESISDRWQSPELHGLYPLFAGSFAWALWLM